MLLQDIRYAVRSLWNSKGFATVAILCLGFGIGLNATIFSVIDGVLLKPYPYTDPDRILVFGAQNQRTDDQSGLSYLDMRDWKEANSVFTTIAAVTGRTLTIADRGGEPECGRERGVDAREEVRFPATGGRAWPHALVIADDGARGESSRRW